MLRTNIMVRNLAKNYLIEVDDKGREEEGGEEGEDFSVPQNIQMEQDGQFSFEVLKFLTLSIFFKAPTGRSFRGRSRGGTRNTPKYIGDSLTLTCKVSSFSCIYRVSPNPSPSQNSKF